MDKLHPQCSDCTHEGDAPFDDSLYYQRSARYANKTIGETNTSMQTYGCVVMSFAYIAKKDPLEVNQIFIDEGVYDGDLVIFDKACDALGLKNYKRDYNINNMPEQEETIKEVWLGKSKHFVVRFNKGGERSIFDPWTGQDQVINFYNFVSYRIFDK